MSSLQHDLSSGLVSASPPWRISQPPPSWCGEMLHCLWHACDPREASRALVVLGSWEASGPRGDLLQHASRHVGGRLSTTPAMEQARARVAPMQRGGALRTR